ncbi:DEAD/DEAH box helicase [Maribacter sp. 2307ULW6-5]|uniref:DEAD/DEAH box helicase n=1 Tax=Maribacter sp. 2307ULW6-5 TaxID=3386275 RepID=UPI0039BD5A8B
MPFKKLRPELHEALERLELSQPTPFQTKAIPVVKSGANVYATAPTGSGKTTTLVLTTLQKLGGAAEGAAPRAVVIVEDKAKVLELHALFIQFAKYTDLRIYASYEQLHIDVQKSEIFEGIDVLISTPATMNKLFLLNGVSTSQLRLFSVDDADFLHQKSAGSALLSVAQSLQKCQYVLYASQLSPQLKRFENYFMERAKKVGV